jgi:tRNA threonylcarbamoyladenosine biosynthesis protein TsaB
LVQDQVIVAERFLMTSGNHAATLLPLVEEMLTATGWRTGQLDGIAVSVGPGSFTGLRVGLSVAKGLAWTAGCAVVAVPTLEALAHAAELHDGSVAALLDARKGELYAAIFRFDGDRCGRQTADALVRPDELIAQLPRPCAIIGDASERYGAWLQERLGSAVQVLPFPEHGPRGGIVARLGWQRLSAGSQTSPADLEPIYIRPPEAAVRFG